jgi:RNA polymerase sigma-70 factor
MSEGLLITNESLIDEIFERCTANAPNFGVGQDCFKASLQKSLSKYAQAAETEPVTNDEVREFLEQIQADDLFMALACANGNERAWWEFDQQHRSYLERVARHLAKTEVDAQEVIDQVYVDLYGTKIVDGERVSKFSTYSGRGSLRGWLRTVIWHSLVDLHRASHDEVSLDELTENVGEGTAHASFAEPAPGGEDEMIDQIARDRYRKATLTALETAFALLDDHEKLLLLYYHVEELKLREIARLVENEASPLRGWFQRKSQTREKNPAGRIHESTIMRWLEKSYAKVLQLFRGELQAQHGLSDEEINICLELATQDLAGNSLFRNLSPT